MSRTTSTLPDIATQLAQAHARCDGLTQDLLRMNGGNPDLYAAMGTNEGYDSLLCSLRGEEAVVEELSRIQDGDAEQ